MADPSAPSFATPANTLVGREREQAVLRDALAAALAGRGSLVLVSGEAGVGKTALAEALCREAADSGASVLVGRCYDLSETPPYGPWRDAGLLARRTEQSRLTPERRRILTFLREHQFTTPAAVAAGLGLTPANAAQALRRLLSRGLVTQTNYGSYALASDSASAFSQTSQSRHTTLAGPMPLPAERGDDGARAARSQRVLFEQTSDDLVALAAQRPHVLLLEDLHWADPASLGLLRFLTRRLDALPLLILATYRDDEPTADRPLYPLLPSLVRESGARRIGLRRLDEGALRVLVVMRYPLAAADADRLVAHLQDRADGNPFFAQELLRALEEDAVLCPTATGWALGDLASAGVPPLLRQIIATRVARLGERAADLLAVGATLGEAVALDLWARVAQVTEEELLAVVARAIEAHLLTATPAGTHARFVHALVRQALYEGTLPPRRRAWHRRAGEELAADPVADPDAVAHHFRRAGDARAEAWLIRAGHLARRAFAHRSAAERYEAALALAPPGAAARGERGWLLVWLAMVRFYDDPRLGMARLEEAGRIAAAAEDRALAAFALYLLGFHRSGVGDYRRGLEEMVAGVSALEALPPEAHARLAAWGHLRRNYLGTLADRLTIVGRYAEAQPLAEQACALGGETQARFALAAVHAAQGQVTASLLCLEEGWAALRRDGAWLELGLYLFIFAHEVVLPCRADDLAGRARLAAEAEAAIARGNGHEGDEDPRLGCLPVLVIEGHWAEATALARAVDAGRRTYRPDAANLLARMAQARGDAGLVGAIVREWLPLGPGEEPGGTHYQHGLEVQRLAAALALDAGDLPTAHAWLAAHDRWLAWSGALLWRAEGQLGWAAYHRAAGDPGAARDHAARALAQATEPRQPLALLAAHRALGALATAVRDHAEATTHLDAALALAEACAAPYERALTLLARAEFHRVAGEYRGAVGALAEARAILEPLAAHPALARANALAARLAARALPDGLSPREVEVLRLLAAGLSNRAIAAALCLSPRTVQRHVANAYLKIDAHNKADATAYALRHGLS